jgi:hypothetical protein
LQYRFGRTVRRITLGRFAAITPDQVRRLVLKALTKLSNSIDPKG